MSHQLNSTRICTHPELPARYDAVGVLVTELSRRLADLSGGAATAHAQPAAGRGNGAVADSAAGGASCKALASDPREFWWRAAQQFVAAYLDPASAAAEAAEAIGGGGGGGAGATASSAARAAATRGLAPTAGPRTTTSSARDSVRGVGHGPCVATFQRTHTIFKEI